MSPASYLAAPPRVAACRIANGRWYDRRVPWWTWIAIGVFAVAAAGGAAGAVVLAVRVFRSLRAFGRTAESALERLTEATGELDRRSEHLSGRSAELDASLGRLRTSLAGFSVLVWALRDALAFVGRLRAAVPSK